MKKIAGLFVVIICFAACKTSQNDAGKKENSLQEKNQHLAYEVLIKEPGFISWKKKQSAISTYEIDFLKEKNAYYTSSFNKRVSNSEYKKELYPSKINYNVNREYGKKVQYNLYNYFIYFQEKYNQQL